MEYKNTNQIVQDYADNFRVQIRKGYLAYFCMLACAKEVYPSEVQTKLSEMGFDVVEGTIYPLLSRLSREGILEYRWQESTDGPPRKYYKLTELGVTVSKQMQTVIKELKAVQTKLEKAEDK